MAQLVVRNLREHVKTRLRERARRHGRSMESEVRDILGSAVSGDAPVRLGSRVAARFARVGLEAPIAEVRGAPAKPARFGR